MFDNFQFIHKCWWWCSLNKGASIPIATYTHKNNNRLQRQESTKIYNLFGHASIVYRKEKLYYCWKNVRNRRNFNIIIQKLCALLEMTRSNSNEMPWKYLNKLQNIYFHEPQRPQKKMKRILWGWLFSGLEYFYKFKMIRCRYGE